MFISYLHLFTPNFILSLVYFSFLCIYLFNIVLTAEGNDYAFFCKKNFRNNHDYSNPRCPGTPEIRHQGQQVAVTRKGQSRVPILDPQPSSALHHLLENNGLQENSFVPCTYWILSFRNNHDYSHPRCHGTPEIRH
ncbi:hypothetical protein CDAR_174621 [Caerostris darwini]|uniref:Uncharacterized protein n=1 Tax=Caerostris darwini TaxID=1538125 RepID=A0AAV4VBW6_9ARAC|nr:hypothetical protein CDAR_174621 [Caerostris darwini]